MADEQSSRGALATELRTFGRRRGRRPSARQERLLNDLLPKVRLDLSRAAPLRLTSLFPIEVDDVWLEIGFGGGEHLIWQARHHGAAPFFFSPVARDGREEREARTPAAMAPARSTTAVGISLTPGSSPQGRGGFRVGLIGCEPFVDGVIKALSAIETERLDNVRLHADDAREVLRWLPPASLGRVFLLFPDPWPKKRHVKRRLFSTQLLDELSCVMRPGAELRLATDVGDYARTGLIAIRRHTHFAWPVRTPDDWRTRPPDAPETRYERRAKAEGRRCYYFRFVRR